MLNSDYLLILLLTQATEIGVAQALGNRDKYLFFSIFFVNLVTNPVLNYILWLNSSFSFFATTIANLILLEILIIVIEGFLLAFALRRNFGSQLPLSAVMNVASFLVGILLLR